MQNHKKLSARILSLALSAAMVFTTLPANVFATEGDISLGASNVECHVTHDKNCGYKEAVEGADCSHENEDGTYSCASVSDNTATPGDADKSACTHKDDCGYVKAVAGLDCDHSCEICKPLDSGNVDKQPEQEHCSCDVLCTEDIINTDCKLCAADDADLTACKGKSAYDKVVELFTALPSASTVTEETTEEEKDSIFARLTEAMDAFDMLTADEQDLFLAEHLELYKAAMALNDAITGATPMPMASLPTITQTINSGESVNYADLKVGVAVEPGLKSQIKTAPYIFTDMKHLLLSSVALH